MSFRLPFNTGWASIRRVEPEQTRQPDNLPAFCRVHRNGRPLIGIMRLLTAPVALRAVPDRPVLPGSLSSALNAVAIATCPAGCGRSSRRPASPVARRGDVALTAVSGWPGTPARRQAPGCHRGYAETLGRRRLPSVTAAGTRRSRCAMRASRAICYGPGAVICHR